MSTIATTNVITEPTGTVTEITTFSSYEKSRSFSGKDLLEISSWIEVGSWLDPDVVDVGKDVVSI